MNRDTQPARPCAPKGVAALGVIAVCVGLAGCAGPATRLPASIPAAPPSSSQSAPVSGASSAAPAPASAESAVTACDPTQLSFAVDRLGGYFNGMSHSGTLVVLRNLGPSSCSVSEWPELTFLDVRQQPLSALPRQQPNGNAEPRGPVQQDGARVAVAAGAELTSQLRWVSSDAYGAGNCVTPAFLALTVGGQRYQVPFETQLCGPANQRPGYTVTPLRRDPAIR